MLIDIGVNLTNKSFDKDLAEVLSYADEQGVSRMIVTGTDQQESEKALALTRQYPQQLFATAGVHPHDAKSVSDDYLSHLKTLHAHPEVVAVGECGLDFNRDFSPRPQQETVFAQQIELAGELGKPLFLHQRDAHDRFKALFESHATTNQQGVLHCFTGNQQELEQTLELGLHVGITGWICDERRGQELRELVKLIPDDKLLLETDAPYLTPRNMRPKPKSSRNQPAYLRHVAQEVAELRGTSLEALAALTRANTEKLFSLYD